MSDDRAATARFVVLEGGEVTGKSTQAARLATRLRAAGHDVVETFEPGATPLGKRLRELLLEGDAPIDPVAEALLMASDRAEHVAEVVRPALARGAWVVSDRFVPSSLAYQGVGRGLGVAEIEQLNELATAGIVPDLVCVAKGLGAGYQPIGATLVRDRVHDAISRGSGAFQHGHTYIGHAAACAGALAVQRRLHEDGLLSRVGPLGKLLEKKLRSAFGSHPNVGDIRGRGLFWGIELVADRATKAPLDPALRTHARIKAEAMSAGLLCYPMGGTLDGARGDHILLAPPFIVEEAQLDELVDKLGRAIHAATQRETVTCAR